MTEKGRFEREGFAKTSGFYSPLIIQYIPDEFPAQCYDLACLRKPFAGDRWDPGKQLWFLKYGKIAGTALEKHIYVDAS